MLTKHAILVVVTFCGRGTQFIDTKKLLYPCLSENLESIYPILPGFSNTPRPPHGRDNCSFSSWWHAQIFFDSRAPVLNHQIPDVLLRNLPLWNIQLLVVPELFCMVGAKGGARHLQHQIDNMSPEKPWNNPEIPCTKCLSRQYSSPDISFGLTSWLSTNPSPSEWAGGSLIATNWGSLENHLGHTLPPLPLRGSLRA